MQISKIVRLVLVVLILTAALGVVSAQDEPQYAGLDKDLSGITIRMAAIGGGQYEAMYDSISVFEEETLSAFVDSLQAETGIEVRVA